MNDFDFYGFEIAVKGKRDAKALNINYSSLHSHKEMIRYGSKVYPRYTYTALVDFMDAPIATKEKVDQRIKELSDKYKRTVRAVYYARD